MTGYAGTKRRGRSLDMCGSVMTPYLERQHELVATEECSVLAISYEGSSVLFLCSLPLFSGYDDSRLDYCGLLNLCSAENVTSVKMEI